MHAYRMQSQQIHGIVDLVCFASDADIDDASTYQARIRGKRCTVLVHEHLLLHSFIGAISSLGLSFLKITHDENAPFLACGFESESIY